MAAVVGREFNLRVLERTSELGVRRLLDVLADAESGRRDRRGPGGAAPLRVRPRARPRDALRRPRRRKAAGAPRHDRRVLEELYRNDLDPHLSEIAHHLALAAPLGDVTGRWTTSSGQAIGPPASSPTRRRPALRAGARPGRGRRGGLARAALRAARAPRRRSMAGRRHPAARGSFEQAAEVARRLGDGEMLAARVSAT